MRWDYQKLRLQRKIKFSNFEKMSSASGLSRDSISKVEKGIPSSIRPATLKRYCLALGVDERDYIVEPGFKFLKISAPDKLDFRPVSHPVKNSNLWTLQPTMISLLSMDISLSDKAFNDVRITSIILKSPQLTKNGKPLVFRWAYWVALDSSRLDNWLGEVDFAGNGSSVQELLLSPGQVIKKELMFSCPSSPAWAIFRKRALEGVLNNTSFQIEVFYEIQGFSVSSQISHISLPVSCLCSLAALAEEKKSELFFGSLSFMQPIVKEGAENECFKNCCSDN